MKKELSWIFAAALLVGCVPTDEVGSAPVSPESQTESDTPDMVEDDREALDDETDTSVDEEQPDPAPEQTGACVGPDPMDRCDADPGTFDEYGAAALVTAFELLDEPCCTDFDDDGEADNALGEGFASIGKLGSLNEELQDSLLNGSQTIVLELDGLDDMETDDELAVHVWNGQWDDFEEVRENEQHPVLLERASIAQGVAPLFSFDAASVREGVLEASKGEIELQVTLNGVAIQPRVLDVTIQGELADGSADAAEGVALRDVEVGGRVTLADIYDQLNATARGCDCLDLETPLIDDDPRADVGVCQQPDTSACEAEGRQVCVGLVEVCPVVDILATNMADVDADGDQVVESISLGAVFDAERAIIEGVAPAVPK